MPAVAQRELGEPARRSGRWRRSRRRSPAPPSRKVASVEHPRDQAEPQRLVGVDHAAGEQQVAGVGLARPPRAAGRCRHAGVHAELHERHAEPGARRGVPQVAGEREAQPGADRRPVDRGDGRHLEPAGSRARPGRTAASGVRRSSTVASGSLAIHDGVAAGAERRARPGHHDRAERRGRPRARRRRPPTTAVICVRHRVALVGVVEGQHGDPVGGALERAGGCRRPWPEASDAPTAAPAGGPDSRVRPAEPRRIAIRRAAARRARFGAGVP